MLNLITDRWIPVITASGRRRIISPLEMSDLDVLRPDWPRADLDIACIEFLIGLICLADPPANLLDWDSRRTPDSARLQSALLPFVGAFNLLGDGPRFLQDLEPLDGTPSSPDLLFIDSAGDSTATKNADLMVRRSRYPALDLPMAAMALYTFQAHAPAGGAGNRTSMRGGGPMVTLVEPSGDCSLWELVWANVPDGVPGGIDDLPWMRKTRVSRDPGTERVPEGNSPWSVEAFFGMPRRLRLVSDDTGDAVRVTGVIQKPYGTNYVQWMHPLSPHYRVKENTEWLPVHPKPGRFGYRNWLGIVSKRADSTTSERSISIREGQVRLGAACSVLVAGWAMSNMSPLDFIWSRQPIVPDDLALEVEGLIEAAGIAVSALRRALTDVLSEGEARDLEREKFYQVTETDLLQCLADLRAGTAPEEVASKWLSVLRAQVLKQFDALAVPGLQEADVKVIERIVADRKSLGLTLAGYGKLGREMFAMLNIDPPEASKTKKGKTG